MRKLLPLALLLCVSFSLSSFAPVHRHMPVVKKGIMVITFPITGTTDGTPGAGQPAGIIDYEISGSGSIPLNIKFFIHGTPTQIGTNYPFTGSGNIYTAASADMKAQTGIIYAQFIIGTGTNGYTVVFAGV